jgi:hypothetical protein
MGSIGKGFSLLLVVILGISSLMFVESAFAQSISKPSVPEFTVKYVDRSYDTPPTYGVDQYTGKTVITKASEHIDNRTIEITINNQPFTPFTEESSGKFINLFYNVQYKGSFGQEWTWLFGVERMESFGSTDPYSTWGYPSQDSASQYTIVSYTLPWNIPSEGQMDFQVEALTGYVDKSIDSDRSHITFAVYNYTFYGEESDWSNTQTITLSAVSVSISPSPSSTAPNYGPTSSPSPTSTIPEFSWLTILPFLAFMPLIAVAIKRSKRIDTK